MRDRRVTRCIEALWTAEVIDVVGTLEAKRHGCCNPCVTVVTLNRGLQVPGLGVFIATAAGVGNLAGTFNRL